MNCTDYSVRSSRSADELITSVLQYTEQTLPSCRQIPPVKEELVLLFQSIGQAMQEMAEALDDNSWKLNFLKLRIRDVAEQIKQETANLEKAYVSLAKTVRVIANSVFRTLHSHAAGASFIREGDHPLIEKEKTLLEQGKASVEQVWGTLEKNMQDNKPSVVTSIIASGNCLKLAPPQMLQVWTWAEERMEVLSALLNVFWIPPEMVQKAVDQAFQQTQFDTIAMPVVVHHFERLNTEQQKRVQQWVQARSPAPVKEENIPLFNNLNELTVRLTLFLKRNGLQVKDPTSTWGDLEHAISQVNDAFTAMSTTPLLFHDKVREAYRIWQGLRDELRQDPLPPGVIRKIELIIAAISEFPDTQEQDEEDEWVSLSLPPSYGSMGSTPTQGREEAQAKAQEMFLTLQTAFEYDDPEAVALDCMGFLLLETDELDLLFALAFSKAKSRILGSLWTLHPFLYLDFERLLSILKIFLNNECYAEAEKMMRSPHFRYVGKEILEIVIKPNAPDSLKAVVRDAVARYEARKEISFVAPNLETLTAFLVQALKNNGWLKEHPVRATEEFQVKVCVDEIDLLLSGIPRGVTNSSVIHLRKTVWPALKTALLADKSASFPALFSNFMEDLFLFRKPLADKKFDPYESKSEESDPAAILLAELSTAVNTRDLTAIKRQTEKISNHLDRLTPAHISEIANMLSSIPFEDLVLLIRKELGDQATVEQINGSVDQFLTIVQMFQSRPTIPQAPPLSTSLSTRSPLLADIRRGVQKQEWAQVQQRMEQYFQSNATLNRPILMAIQRLLEPTPLEELKMMLAAMLD